MYEERMYMAGNNIVLDRLRADLLRREVRKMLIKGCKTIAEYAFRRWMQEHLFAEGYFTLEVSGNDGTIKDMNGDTLELHYNNDSKCVEVNG